ncbi:TM2 domain-containing protein [Bifidobacterium sp. ESL0784]|uniref:TM2 domain-containing protein n=1 Tax=Bifidobacterium sp. ESL0784 TaxID=2983231 RepID=UPI0023F674A2|nr:TM2 domain-containing protein [Bifidobacterium sp. ESL0784]MDF7640352.1 TM2 domain-containing protein [Bifidobacterium sp. ESL0784]
MNNTPDPQGGQSGAQTPQGSDNQQGSNVSQGQQGGAYGQYQGQSEQYGQSQYGQAGASQSSQQPNYAQPNYGQPQQSQYSQPNYGQAGYAQPDYGQPNYGYAPGGYSDPYSAQNQSGYPQGQPYMAQYGQPEPLPYGYQPKSKMAAGLLGIFLGCLGVHNFYLGFYGKAVAQLLLTLVGWILFGLGPVAAFIWGLIEGVLILSSNYGSPWHRDAKGVELRE